MSDQDILNSILKCADLYNQQGLYAEAKDKYAEALFFVSGASSPEDVRELRETLENKIRLMDGKIAECDEEDELPELSGDIQNIIDHFSFSGRKERTAFEEAFALMRSGQYKRATAEFEKLLSIRVYPLVAASNIVACLFLLGQPEVAVERFKEWCDKDWLTIQELLHIRNFLKLSLVERKITAELPFPPREPRREGEPDPEPLISTMTIEFEEGALKGRTEELKVTFQFSSLLSSIVPPSRKDLIDSLEPGATLKRVRFYSSQVLFTGRGKVTSRSVLKRGPCKGQYLFDFSIEAE